MQAKIGKLLQTIKVDTHGAAAEAMEQRGLHYEVNYGVALPSIRIASKTYFPDNQLAKEIYLSKERELILASLYIYDPHDCNIKDADFWAQGVVTIEVADILAMKLLSSSPDAWDFAFLWLNSENPLLCYASLMCGLRIMDDTSLDFISAVSQIKHKEVFVNQAIDKIEQKFDMMLQGF